MECMKRIAKSLRVGWIALSLTCFSAAGAQSGAAQSSAKAPAVTVTPGDAVQPFAENLIVTVKVSGGDGTPTGTVVLSGGGYKSEPAKLDSGSANFYIAPGSLARGSDILTATYAPDPASQSHYLAATGKASITITAPGAVEVAVHIDVLANRHEISPYIYGINASKFDDIKGLTPGLVRWGGNQASDYNWKLFTYNSGGDWFFNNYPLGDNKVYIADSVLHINFVQSTGSHVLTTMPTLDWVAGESGHWTYSVKKFGPQCKTEPSNPDAGNGKKPDCKTRVTDKPVTDAYYPLVDSPRDCTTGNCVYRDEWARALSAAFGSGTCKVPYSAITSCHFYDMDNEPEIWDGVHGDVHPVHPGYEELADRLLATGAKLKQWDQNAVRFGPVTCCWNFRWNAGPDGDRKAHASIDFIPWWLNRVYFADQVSGERTLDVFDLHAYVGANVDISKFTDAQKRAAAVGMFRNYWDPTYYNAGNDADWMTTMQPTRGVVFDIPRMKAMVNAIYPGTPLSYSEWEGFVVPQAEWDFATALSDADGFGVMGREGLSFSTRWGGPDETDDQTHQPHPNFRAMKLYTNYDAAGHRFGTLSVADQANVDSDRLQSFAALDSDGSTMTIMVLNKDPNNATRTSFKLDGYRAKDYRSYSLVSTNPGAITVSEPALWSGELTFAPYSVTLLVVRGEQSTKPASEWFLNPDDLMIPAFGSGVLHPKLISGSAPATLTSAVFDTYEGAGPCRGSLQLANPKITAAEPATITVKAGYRPAFCHYTVTGTDGTVTQTQGGWIVVGRPSGTLTAEGDNQFAAAGKNLPKPLTVTIDPGDSGATPEGAEILFSTSAGTLTSGKASGSRIIALTNANGTASVTLTLPSSKGTVKVTAQDQFALGGRSVTFAATAK
jgi:hypothetical protein